MKKNYIAFSVLLLFFATQSKAQTNINVVFHVVWKTAAQDIADSCLQHQLDVLNEDFNAANPDLWKVPSAWQPIIGNMNVNFVLASQDPSGNPTNGIERIQTTVSSFTTNNNVMHNSTGGLDAWPDTSYLNIWVCNMNGIPMSYSQFPGGPAATDGVVIDYRGCGRGSYCMAPFDHGRSGTHAVAHRFGLRNFAPSQGCATDDDQMPDTPTYTDPLMNGAYNSFQVVTDACNPSSPGIMWMNFMTFMNDTSMYFFTQDQTDTMTWVMNNMRTGLGGPTGIHAAVANTAFSVFPSPSSDGNFRFQRTGTADEALLYAYNSLGAVAAIFPLSASEQTGAISLSG
jgi:hypothetical protein